MGVTISSKRYSCDMGYGGFCRFRDEVAKQTNPSFYEHYTELSSSSTMCLSGKERKKYFEKYDALTNGYINIGAVSIEVANFLYQSDCEGKIDRKQAKKIYRLIKDCDDNDSFGYAGRKDCAKMSDLKNIFSDGTKVEWS